MKNAQANAMRIRNWAGPALLLALMLAGSLPVAAQNLILPARRAPLATPAFSARLQSPALAAAADYPDRLTMVVAADDRDRNHNLGIRSTVDYMKTAFVEQKYLPVARVLGGRFELGGFSALRPMENVLLGPPASNATTKGHPAISVPRADESYGIRLTIHLKDGPQSEHRLQIWSCLGWVVGAGRGCHLN